MFEIRGGARSADRRLDRVPLFDAKSKKFPVRSLFSPKQTSTPRTFVWKLGTNLDQGAEGACVGFAITHELLAPPVPVTGVGAKFARERIYWEAQKIDPWPGGAYPGASPFYEGTAVLSGMKVAQRLGFITEYRWSFSIEDLVTTVGYVGPVVLGIPWKAGMRTPDARGVIHPTGSTVGGHAILCKGVNVKSKMFRLHNSWGPNWGLGGDCLISWSDLDMLLHSGGEAAVPITRKNPRKG